MRVRAVVSGRVEFANLRLATVNYRPPVEADAGLDVVVSPARREKPWLAGDFELMLVVPVYA
jgi:hypothetical protein